MLELLRLIGLLCTVVAGIHAGWWLLLAVIALPPPRPKEVVAGYESVAVVVPAHNEELMVESTVRSLLAAAPRHPGPVEIYVVADNCTDNTAELAAAAGATVWERSDPTLCGKGYALDFAIMQLRSHETPPDIVVFVDADTEVSENFIAAIADRIRRGAQVVQVYYAAGPGDEPIRRIRRLAFALIHWTRPLGASRLGLGTSLKGNGMAYRWDIARQGLGGSGIVEDAEMSLRLAAQGIVITFEPRATVWGHMASNWSDAAVQDVRWERGRLAHWGAALVSTARSLSRNPRATHGAVEVSALSLTVVAGLALLGSLSELLTTGGAWSSGLVLGSMLAYVFVGWSAARVSVRDLAVVAMAPLYLVHKLRVLFMARTPAGWNTTARR